jgi:hypothetical protein
MRTSNLIMLAGIFGVMPALSIPASSQIGSSDRPSAAPPDLTSVADCHRPDDAKEAKVVEVDTGKSLAKLAVNLGSGRFKLVRITVWDRPEDPRPLVPVIEAARIMQGTVQFYTPSLNSDPESAHDSFILMADMGGGYVCWATPSSLISESKPGSARRAADPSSRSEMQPKSDSTPTAAVPAARAQPDAKSDTAPAAVAPVTRSRSRTGQQATPAQ